MTQHIHSCQVVLQGSRQCIQSNTTGHRLIHTSFYEESIEQNLNSNHSQRKSYLLTHHSPLDNPSLLRFQTLPPTRRLGRQFSSSFPRSHTHLEPFLRCSWWLESLLWQPLWKMMCLLSVEGGQMSVFHSRGNHRGQKLPQDEAFPQSWDSAPSTARL